MNRRGAGIAGYLLIGGLGAAAGALAILALTRVIPRMLSQILSRTMGNALGTMMAEMGGQELDPESLYRGIMEGFEAGKVQG